MAGLDGVVVDLVDVGTRVYTYASTMGLTLEAAAAADLDVTVLDRPNPLGARVEGPILEPRLRSFIGYHPVPVRHGLTLGELATLFVREKKLTTQLRVVDVKHWNRDTLWPAGDEPWRPPSPNLPQFRSALLYPGVALLEATNVSVGRGTDAPFQRVGAPWLDAESMVRDLDRASLRGVAARAERFTPTIGPYAGQSLPGVRLDLTDPPAVRAVRVGLALALSLQRHHPRRWRAQPMLRHLGDEGALRAIREGRSPDQILGGWRPRLASWMTRTQSIRRYRTSAAGTRAPSRPPSRFGSW
ncbi:MAG: DUF1343 domain-containing protein [Myxococcota bacterium]